MRALLAGLSVALLATSLWLWRDNRRLREELALRPATATPAVATPEAASATADESPERPRRDTPRGGARLLGMVARLMTGPPPADDTQRPAEVPESRRDRRQQFLRSTLGRADGETDEQYRERVVPLMQTMLSRPRQRVEDQRAEFETAAELTPEQRTGFDQALADARNELVGLASKAVTAGELTPYRRNSLGLLNFVGGAAAIVDGFDARFRQLLGPEQVGLLEDTGFDVIEYLGFTTQWETVTPPPPAPRP